jgi:hypothetical protein
LITAIEGLGLVDWLVADRRWLHGHWCGWVNHDLLDVFLISAPATNNEEYKHEADEGKADNEGEVGIGEGGQ